RLVIVADGALHYLPFAALPDPASGDPLLITHEVVHLPSASVLAIQRRELQDRTPAPAALAVLADPVFSPSDPRVGGGRGPSGPAQATGSVVGEEGGAHTKEPSRAGSGLAPEGVFDRLPATRREAESIAALASPAESLTALDFQASRQTALQGGLDRYRIVHFATHGVIQAETPELSGLALSMVDEAGRPADGFLGLRDIYNLRLRAGLVVLSGCETALGREIRGEGLAGLARGFMYAGAARVVASLWRVEDRATAELMTRFYQGLLVDRLPPAAALRRAQLAIRAERRWRDAYHWAPFVLMGDWN
ncbi:MAG TPA: CHAT domain-containing protein, partial [Thermoanaerobaculia bacterium]|nr:CHAT domain-containing protein [Thermoanaerobaculia bacterium]